MKLVVLLLAALAIASCGLRGGDSPLVDGIRVGPTTDCSQCDEFQIGPNCGTCESIPVLARRGLDDRWPGHSPVVELTFHEEGASRGLNGELILNKRSGSLTVALATFADGAQHANAVFCGGSGCVVLVGYETPD